MSTFKIITNNGYEFFMAEINKFAVESIDNSIQNNTLDCAEIFNMISYVETTRE